jgi:hypothetical protein
MANIWCVEAADGASVDTGAKISTYTTTQTVTSLGHQIVVTPTTITPGGSFTLSDGGGCGVDSASGQLAFVELYNPNGLGFTTIGAFPVDAKATGHHLRSTRRLG